MADTTKLTIELEVLLRNLNRTLRGLGQIEQRLRKVASIRVGTASTAPIDRQAAATQRFAGHQQRLAIQTQELANRQERARQAAERLTLSQQRLARAQQNVTQASRGLNIQQDRHVQVFRALERASQQFNRTLTSLGNSLRSVGQGLASFGATLTFSVSAPLAALGVGIVDAAVRMDSLRRGLTTIAGSSEQAAVQLERLTEIAKLPGIGFEEAIQGSIALQAVGFSAQDAEKALIQFSNAVALTGGSREQLQTITVQLGQMAAQSKVLAADLKPIINAAPAVAVALRNMFGTVRSEEIQELGIQSKDFIDIMIRELDKLPRATAGARNSFDNFRDTVFRAAATIGDSLLPALVRLADAFGPILTAVANAFAALPAPIQSTVIVIGALAVALGPMTFIFGQLLSGLGRVVVGFAQLNAMGLLNISTFRLLGQVMIGTTSLAQGAAATAAAAATGWGLLALAVVGVLGVIAAIATLSTRTKEHVATTEEQIRATQTSLKVLREQQDVLNKVTKETQAVADVSDELKSIYKSLNKESQGRVEQVRRELGLTQALRQEIARLITVREGEQRIQAATVATAITETAQQAQSLGQQIDSTINRVEQLKKVREELIRTGRLPRGVSDPILVNVASLNDAAKQLEAIDKGIQRLSGESLPDLRKQSDDTTASLAKQSDQLQQLEFATGRSTREILEQAKAYGLFKGDVDVAATGIENFRKAQISLEAALSGTTEEIIKQRLELRKLSVPADAAQKQRQIDIQQTIDIVREQSNTIEEARKNLEKFVKEHPEVGKSIETELRKRPIEDFLKEALGAKRARGARSETSLRNAQQQLADALEQIAIAAGERQLEIERDRNEAFLRAQEVAQQLRIISYREYLETRANLTEELLDKEITQQQAVFRAAKTAEQRLLREAQRAGIPAAERTRRQAQAKQAEAEAIRAEARLAVLQQQLDRVAAERTQAIRLAQDQQLRDTIQLEIQFAELQGRIQAAMEVAVVEEFREALEDLGKAQDFLNRQIEKAKQLRQTERVEELERSRNLNQRQIEAINNIIRQRTALAELAAAEKLVENAKERQQRLEADLAFQVQFRGLSEEEAIRRRLDGEKRLQASIELSKSIITDLQQQLIALGVAPPPQLQEFVDNLKKELLGLGELSFTEQFRLAEKEFQRLNDERLRRIADVERAVNNRTISEAEGLLFIRRINGQYVGDLEQQLALLKEIAARSKDASLQRQAQSAEETVKDAGDKLADFNTQLRATSIDALRGAFVDFFQSLRDNTISAKERLLNLIDSVVARVNEVIAENLFDEFIKSLFGDGTEGEGIITRLKRVFGLGGERESSGESVAKAALESSQAATALTTGATSAAAALTSGGATAGATLATSVSAAAAAFAAAVTAAGAAFAATVAASSAAQSGAQFARIIGGGAVGGLFDAVPGGVYRALEGGYPEAVLTTDPKHYVRQLAILRAYLRETRGLGGRIREFAAGGFPTPELSLNVPSIPPLSVGLGDMEVGPSSQPINFRNINLFDRKEMVRGYIRSAEGARDIMNVISENGDEFGRRLGIK